MEHASEARYAANRLRVKLEGDYRTPKDPQVSARYSDLKDTLWALRQAAREAQYWIDRFRVANRGRLLTKWDLSSDEDRRWMQATLLSRTVTCHTCDHPMVTEADFAKHYVVEDPDHPGLGYCWTKEGDRRGA